MGDLGRPGETLGRPGKPLWRPGVSLGRPGENLGRPVDNKQSFGYSTKLWTINKLVYLGDLGRLWGDFKEKLGRL